MRFPARIKTCFTALLAAAILSGCATSGNPGTSKDPFEKFNRAMFTFNDTVDQAAIKPAAMTYKDVLPNFVQTGIGNFFGNIGDVWTAINNLLQGKAADGLTDIMRVALNTTFGLAGVIDIGSEAGLMKHKEDFGQTLGVWGVKPGPYVVLPVYGSFTMRDALAFPLDFLADPWGYVYPATVRNVGTAVRLVDKRAVVLDASDLIEEAALDKYVFVRDAYLQRRQGQIDKGERPYESFNDEEPLPGDEVKSVSAASLPPSAADAAAGQATPVATGTDTTAAAKTDLTPVKNAEPAPSATSLSSESASR